MIDQANLYLNLSNKMCSQNQDVQAHIEYNSQLGIYHSKPHYLRQTTAKTGNYTGANVTWADSNQKKYYK